MHKTALLSLACACVLLGAAAAAADDLECPPHVTTNWDGDVIVTDANGEPCRIDGVTIGGNVKLLAGGSVLITEGAVVEGSVQTEESGALRVRIRDSEIVGDVQLQDMISSQNGVIVDTAVGGTVELQANAGDPGVRFTVRNSAINGDLKVNDNSYRVRIGGQPGNFVGGNLQCQGNAPAPRDIGTNIVDGNKEDQCAGF